MDNIIDYSGQRLENIDFSGKELERYNFSGAELVSCNFDKAIICLALLGLVLFTHAKISNSSLNKTYFGDSAFLKRENLVRGRIIEQDKNIYRKFLVDWHENAMCERSNVSLLEYGQALGVSLKNMAGMDSEVLLNVSPLVDMLNVIQTTIGIILTGIFGFILGNKIRNQ